MVKTILEIHNLKCGGCENTIKKRLKNFDFVRNIEVDADQDTVGFELLTPKDLSLIKRQLSILDYSVTEDSNSLVKKAKSYVSCALGKI